MSSSYTRSNETDSYQILSSYGNTVDDAEVAIVSALVKGNLGEASDNEWISSANETSWNYSMLDPSFVDTSALANYPAGTVTKNSVILTQFNGPSETQVYTTSLSNAGVTGTNSFDAYLTADSAAFYDCNYFMVQSHLQYSYDNAVSAGGSVPEGAKVQVEMDQTNSNHHAHRAMNSSWNTMNPAPNNLAKGDDAIAITQDVDYNTSSALGQEGTDGSDYTAKYATSSTVDGSISFTPISNQYQPQTNNIEVVDRTSFTEFNTDSDVGLFRVQNNLNDAIQTTVTLEEGSSTDADPYLVNMPLMDANANSGVINKNTPKSDLNLPGTMDAAVFYSLFNTAVANTVVEGYTYQIDVTDNSAGYSVNIVDENVPNNRNQMISTLDNSNLLDNPYYMANYVTAPHEISFSNAGLVIDPSTNGVLNTANSITIDLSQGETLSSSYAGVNGEIKIDSNVSNTRATDIQIVDMSGTSDNSINVWYEGDNGVGSNSTLNNEMMTNPFLTVYEGKVALNSWNEPSENIFVGDGAGSGSYAFMTLYANEVVNTLFNPDNTSLTFNNNFEDDSVRLWRIQSQSILVAQPESFYENYDDYSNIGQNLVQGISVQSVLQNILSTLTDYSSYRCTLTAKTLQDISLTSSVADVSNWSINYSNESDAWLTSSSDLAFNNTNSLPNYDSALVASIANGANIYYSYEYKTMTTSSTYGGLQDYVQVSYSQNQDMSNSTVFTIPQPDITRTYSGSPSTTSNDVAPSLYQFAASIYNSETWKLVQLVKTNTFDVSFSPRYGVFNNIKLTITGIVQTDTYYALQNITTLQIAPHSALQYVQSSTITNLTQVVESISVESGSTSISGVLGNEDITGFNAIIEAKQTSDGNWVTISSDPINFDTYYALPNESTLTIQSQDTSYSANVVTSCEYSPFTDMIQQSIVLQLNNQNYYIPFEYNPTDAVYSLTSFTSNPADLFETTNLALPNLAADSNFTVTNNYACTNSSSWTSGDYNLSVDSDENIVTFTVYDNSENTVFTFTKPANEIFLGTVVLTYIPLDIWHTVIYVGASSSDNTLYESFQSTTYPDSILQIADGINVVVGSTTDLVGCSVAFRVLGDFVTINEVGAVADPTSANELGQSSYNNGSLNFQFVDEDPSSFSAVFIFDKYRGFPSPSATDVVQDYTIVRDSTSVTFVVGEDDLTQVLTTNMYYDQLLVVDDLVDASDNTCADLNVAFNVLYSLPPTGATLVYEVSLTGDNVQVTISNPNFTGSATNIPVPDGSSPVVDPLSQSFSSTLIEFGQNAVYTFSGTFSETEEIVAVRPSRIKINNTAFPYSFFTYQIYFDSTPINVYQAVPVAEDGVNYLGDPALVDDNDPNVFPDNSSRWHLHTSLTTYAQKLAGVNIGAKKIKIHPELPQINSVSFFVSTPPQHKFEIMSTNGSPQLPYNHGTDHVENNVITYFPQLDGVDTFNPFAETISRSDINGNDCTISHDPTDVNDATFTLLQPPSVLDMVQNPDSARVGIIVAGVNISITLYSGLYDSTLKAHLIYNGPITSIPTEVDVLTNKLVFLNRNEDGSIVMGMVQDPTDVGYSSGLTGYEEVFRTTDQIKYYNMDLYIGNVSWFNDNNPETYFNGYADGVRPTLYTVVDLNDSATKKNFRRVYKYETTSTYDFQNLTPIQTMSMVFTLGRQYFDTTVEAMPFTTNANAIANYSDLLEQTNIGEISWTDDINFSEDVTVSWAFGNRITATKMNIDLFSVEESEVKWSFLTLLPFQSFQNQFGLTVSEVSWDGSVYTPLVSTQVINLSPQLSNPSLNQDNSSIEQYSKSTLQSS